jgi:N-acetylmuramoyl-L-alanine amidase
MAKQLWLPGVLRAAGLTVVEVPGWQDRTGDDSGDGTGNYHPIGLICHATAGSRTSTPDGELHTLLTGSTSAPAPIAQTMLDRQGRWYVVAAGVCWHALKGWGGPLAGYGNYSLIGVEAMNDNRGEPWPAEQYASYARGVAAICRHQGWSPAHQVAGHKEHQPGDKTDPTFSMTTFRLDVVEQINRLNGDDMPFAQDRDAVAVMNRLWMTVNDMDSVTYTLPADAHHPSEQRTDRNKAKAARVALEGRLARIEESQAAVLNKLDELSAP